MSKRTAIILSAVVGAALVGGVAVYSAGAKNVLGMIGLHPGIEVVKWSASDRLSGTAGTVAFKGGPGVCLVVVEGQLWRSAMRGKLDESANKPVVESAAGITLEDFSLSTPQGLNVSASGGVVIFPSKDEEISQILAFAYKDSLLPGRMAVIKTERFSQSQPISFEVLFMVEGKSLENDELRFTYVGTTQILLNETNRKFRGSYSPRCPILAS